jgi:hypothetical protein
MRAAIDSCGPKAAARMGRVYFEQGLAAGSNPFAVGSENHADFERGWWSAYRVSRLESGAGSVTSR